jgi:membrane-associated phospholipid phosphatase
VSARAARSPVGRGTAAALAAAAAAGLVALAVVVVAGGAARVDQYAVDHWMPKLRAGNDDSPMLTWHLLYPHLGSTVDVICNLWTFPASPLVSALVFALGCWTLARRGRRDAALAWAVAFVLANAVEVLGKGVLTRPALHASGVAYHGFDTSFPSGHTVRALLLVALVSAVWPRLTWPAVVWAALAVPALVLNGDHTPSDVLGGVLLAVLSVAAVETWLGSRAGAPAPGRLRAAVAEDG